MKGGSNLFFLRLGFDFSVDFCNGDKKKDANSRLERRKIKRAEKVVKHMT